MSLLLNVGGRERPVMDLLLMPFLSPDGRRFFFLARDRRRDDEPKVFHAGACYQAFENLVCDYFRRSGAKDLVLCLDPKSFFNPKEENWRPLSKNDLGRLRKKLWRRFGRKHNWPRE